MSNGPFVSICKRDLEAFTAEIESLRALVKRQADQIAALKAAAVK